MLDRRYGFIVPALNKNLIHHYGGGPSTIPKRLEEVTESLNSQVLNCYKAGKQYLKEAIKKGGQDEELAVWREKLQIAEAAIVQTEAILTELSRAIEGLKGLPVLVLRLDQLPK